MSSAHTLIRQQFEAKLFLRYRVLGGTSRLHSRPVLSENASGCYRQLSGLPACLGCSLLGVRKIQVMLLLLVCARYSYAQADSAQEVLRGHPVAQVASLGYGAGLSHKWMSFFFAVEQSDGSVKPIEVGYAFFHSNQLPPDSFWDYSKLYEIRVIREKGCDTKVESLAYVKNVDANGRELTPTFVLAFAKGAPKDLLKLEDVLPCYTLWHGKYRQVQLAK